MINSLPSVDPKGVYELKAASESLEVSKSTLLRWTQQGFIRCSIRRSNKRKVWTGEAIIKFWKSMY